MTENEIRKYYWFLLTSKLWLYTLKGSLSKMNWHKPTQLWIKDQECLILKSIENFHNCSCLLKPKEFLLFHFHIQIFNFHDWFHIILSKQSIDLHQSCSFPKRIQRVSWIWVFLQGLSTCWPTLGSDCRNWPNATSTVIYARKASTCMSFAEITCSTWIWTLWSLIKCCFT